MEIEAEVFLKRQEKCTCSYCRYSTSPCLCLYHRKRWVQK